MFVNKTIQPPCPVCKQKDTTDYRARGFFRQHVQMVCTVCGTAGPIVRCSDWRFPWHAAVHSWRQLADPDGTWVPDNRPPRPSPMFCAPPPPRHSVRPETTCLGGGNGNNPPKPTR